MALLPGARLGPYEVLGLIGAGGMGEVYKATDTRLNRTVAIKVLPTGISCDPHRRARLEREAKTIATLSHPHICTLHDVGQHAGSLFLVMEHLEGQTLAERLRKGALPIEQALEYGAQIAQALAAAHREGVVHRDLKPANVMLTKSGVKLLDFGLAKLRREPIHAPAASGIAATTQTDPLTDEGTLLGTIQYMAPEQLEGKETDARTDIWALGLVLYEMITGKRAFDGDSSASLIAAILDQQPRSPSTLQPVAPPALDRLVLRCLVKDADERWDSARDVGMQLSEVLQAGWVSTRDDRTRRRRVVLAVVSVLALAGAMAIAGIWYLQTRLSSSSPRVIRLNIPLQAPQLPWGGGWLPMFAVSPSGVKIVYHNGSDLVVRALDSFDERPLLGTGYAYTPVFSPDDRWIAFAHDNAVKKVSVSGGPITEISPMFALGGLAWGEDDRIYLTGLEGIWRVPSGGGVAEQLTRVDPKAGEQGHVWPQLIKGTSDLLFTAIGPSGGSDDSRVVVRTLGTGIQKTIVDHAVFGRYVPPGHLLFARNNGTVFHVLYDTSRRELAGSPTPVLSGVQMGMFNGITMVSVSETNTLAYIEGSIIPHRSLRLFDDKGRDLGPVGPDHLWTGGARFSPDGHRLAVSGGTTAFERDIWVHDLVSRSTERVTWDPAEDERGIWSPDGQRLAYPTSADGTSRKIHIKTIGAQTASVLRTWPTHLEVTSWSVDGRWLACWDAGALLRGRILALPLDGGEPVSVANGAWPVFSPDGRWLAYEAFAGERVEVFLTSFPTPNVTRQISNGGGGYPLWDRSGKKLYYLTDGPTLVSVSISLRDPLTWGAPTPLFKVPGSLQDVSPDGRSFLVVIDKDPSPGSIRVVVNWREELTPSSKR